MKHKNNIIINSAILYVIAFLLTTNLHKLAHAFAGMLYIYCFLGAGILLFIAYHLSIPFLKFSYKKEWVDTRQSRKNFSFCILILPWIIGSAVMTFLYLPIVAVVSIIYPLQVGWFLFSPGRMQAELKICSYQMMRDWDKFHIWQY